jgi:hypothetical protein
VLVLAGGALLLLRYLAVVVVDKQIEFVVLDEAALLFFVLVKIIFEVRLVRQRVNLLVAK